MEKTFLNYELVELERIPKPDVIEYWNEFLQNGEKENVLWELEQYDIDTYYERQHVDMRNRRYGFVVDGKLCGMLRISGWVHFPANGMLGYSIRPSVRGKGLGNLLIRMATEHCSKYGPMPASACVDVRNEVSRHILKRNGFVETGRVFDWKPNPEPRKAIELSYWK